MMVVNDELVKKLADLARLEFDEKEFGAIREDLQRMIAFVEKLNEIDTRNVEPLLHISEEENILREDEVKGMITPEEALKNAPDRMNNFFVVPKVIKK